MYYSTGLSLVWDKCMNTEENLNIVTQTCQCYKAADFFELSSVNNGN